MKCLGLESPLFPYPLAWIQWLVCFGDTMLFVVQNKVSAVILLFMKHFFSVPTLDFTKWDQNALHH